MANVWTNHPVRIPRMRVTCCNLGAVETGETVPRLDARAFACLRPVQDEGSAVVAGQVAGKRSQRNAGRHLCQCEFSGGKPFFGTDRGSNGNSGNMLAEIYPCPVTIIEGWTQTPFPEVYQRRILYGMNVRVLFR